MMAGGELICTWGIPRPLLLNATACQATNFSGLRGPRRPRVGLDAKVRQERDDEDEDQDEDKHKVKNKEADEGRDKDVNADELQPCRTHAVHYFSVVYHAGS